MMAGGEGGDILGGEGGVEGERGGERGDEMGVGIRVRAAQCVVEMEDDGYDAELGSERGEGAQQGHGVSAAADGDSDALARSDEAMLAQVALERVEHGNMIAEADGAWFVAALGRKIQRSALILKHSRQGDGGM